MLKNFVYPPPKSLSVTSILLCVLDFGFLRNCIPKQVTRFKNQEDSNHNNQCIQSQSSHRLFLIGKLGNLVYCWFMIKLGETDNVIFTMIIVTHLQFVHHPSFVWRPWCFINSSNFHFELKMCHTVPTQLYIFMQEQQLGKQEFFHTSPHEDENRTHF
jgi:hypothetical protein